MQLSYVAEDDKGKIVGYVLAKMDEGQLPGQRGLRWQTSEADVAVVALVAVQMTRGCRTATSPRWR